jgi:hypothetical protein
MNFDKVDDTNFLLYAAKHYDNPQYYDTLEFYDDLNRFKYLKRLFNRYEESGDLKERLILNHLIVLYNMFGVATTKLLFFKLEGHYGYLKPFLILLNQMPEVIHGIGIENKTIRSSDIKSDEKIVEILRKI